MGAVTPSLERIQAKAIWAIETLRFFASSSTLMFPKPTSQLVRKNLG